MTKRKGAKPGSVIVTGYRMQPIAAMYHGTDAAEAKRLFAEGTGIFYPVDDMGAQGTDEGPCSECESDPRGMCYRVLSVTPVPETPA